MEKDLLYKIALTLVPNIGDATAKNLIAFFGSAEKVFTQSNVNQLINHYIKGEMYFVDRLTNHFEPSAFMLYPMSSISKI